MSTNDNPSPRLAYSPAEAARLLSVSRGHIYNLIERGDLTVIKLGRSARVTAESIDKLLASS